MRKENQFITNKFKRSLVRHLETCYFNSAPKTTFFIDDYISDMRRIKYTKNFLEYKQMNGALNNYNYCFVYKQISKARFYRYL